jgi:hypothetical protein
MYKLKNKYLNLLYFISISSSYILHENEIKGFIISIGFCATLTQYMSYDDFPA